MRRDETVALDVNTVHRALSFLKSGKIDEILLIHNTEQLGWEFDKSTSFSLLYVRAEVQKQMKSRFFLEEVVKFRQERLKIQEYFKDLQSPGGMEVPPKVPE
jgi:hypothetical protein